MSHEISIRNDGTAEIAYVGETPWHGLGQKLTEGAPIEQWRIAAGMDWTIERTPALYRIDTPAGKVYSKVPERDVLHRSDTKAPLGIVSDRYKAVQPAEVLEFFRDLVTAYEYRLDVAGVLFGGKKFWALAKTPDGDYVADKNDRINRFLLLSTSCDGSSATIAKNTAVRVVCWNTWQACMLDGNAHVKASHRSTFNADAVKKELGIERQSFADFMQEMRDLAAVKVSPITARAAAASLFPSTRIDTKTKQPINPLHTYNVSEVIRLFEGGARGSQFAGVQGTAYGFVQAVGEFVDHLARAHTNDNRIDSAYFGRGDDLKQEAIRTILELAA